MRAGELRHRVTLQSVTVARDAVGGTTETWTDQATVWAAIEPLRGREYWDAAQVAAEATYRVRMRYRAGVSPEMRLTYQGRTLEIESVTSPDERRRELELICREVVG